MVKSIVLMQTAEDLRQFGHQHPMGPEWRGIHDLNPAVLTRERMIQFCKELDTRCHPRRISGWHAQQVAAKIKGFIDAGVTVPTS